MGRTSRRKIGTIVFLIGVASGLALALGAVWGDFEATSYFYTGAGNEPLAGLSCPVMISAAERASVYETFDNPSDKETQQYYQVSVSGVTGLRTIEDQVNVPGHTSKTVSWTVDARDIDLGSFVMVQVKVLPVAGHTTRAATCGILVLTTDGISGTTLFDIALALSLLGIPAGLALREAGQQALSGKALSGRNALRAVGIATLLALLAGLIGWWAIGLICAAVGVLLLVISVRVEAW